MEAAAASLAAATVVTFSSSPLLPMNHVGIIWQPFFATPRQRANIANSQNGAL